VRGNARPSRVLQGSVSAPVYVSAKRIESKSGVPGLSSVAEARSVGAAGMACVLSLVVGNHVEPSPVRTVSVAG